VEPLLSEVRLDLVGEGRNTITPLNYLQLVIVGGESGSGARPMHPAWVRSLRDQTIAAGVPFFFKQWGEWCPAGSVGQYCFNPGASIHSLVTMNRVGKKKAGRLLDGREWSEFPAAAQHEAPRTGREEV
jgi:protein gp37